MSDVTTKTSPEATESTDHEPTTSVSDETQASRLIKLADGAALFHTPTDEAYVTVAVGKHRETYALDSRAFKNWLGEKLFKATNKAASDQALKAAISILEARAVFDGPEQDVHLRVAQHEGDIFIDLGDPEWRAVRVSAKRPFEVLTTSPVKFRRPRGLLALPAPTRGGSVNDLSPFVNVNGQQQFDLLVGSLLSDLRPTGPYPVLEINGDQGSAKSTMSKLIRALVDPNSAPVRSLGNERDLMIGANNGWCLVFDNISHLSKATSDALCRLATGGALSVRKLYANDEEMLFNAQRPVVLNGIGHFVTESDLLDRVILLELPTLRAARRQDEARFWAAFAEAHPKIFGALLDAVSAAMRGIPFVAERPDWPRMADAAKWVTAAEPHLGRKVGSFMTAYNANRKETNARVLDDDRVATLILELSDRGQWSGTATDLLDVVNPEKVMWLPRTAAALSKRLRELTPNLKAAGVPIEFTREGVDSKKMIHIGKRIARHQEVVDEAA